MSNNGISKPLSRYAESLIAEVELIADWRIEALNNLASIVKSSLDELGYAKLVFICTHNSRRSQLAELWFSLAATYFDITSIETYSGGTEATEFNRRMVDAVRRADFDLKSDHAEVNPRYEAFFTPDGESSGTYFSKVYDHPENPNRDFIAVMVCSDADENCPVVSGARHRFSLPYLDPKAYDDTPEERLQYDKKVREIGREMLYLAKVCSK